MLALWPQAIHVEQIAVHQMYLPCQVALGCVRISMLQQDKAPGGPGGFPAGAGKAARGTAWEDNNHDKQVCVLCYRHPNSGNLQLRSFSTKVCVNTFIFPPMNVFDCL